MSVINTNITSLIGQHNLSKSQSALQTSMERLSSGLRINSAKDDAAGQAIANRMTAQITGLAQAQRNANDGISIAQTAEGSLNQVNDNLQRIRELTVQAANGTNSTDDLQSIQDEINQRLDEIDRISEETNFNGVNVLNTNEGLQIQVGANDGETISVGLQIINRETLGLDGFNVSNTLLTDNLSADSISEITGTEETTLSSASFTTPAEDVGTGGAGPTGEFGDFFTNEDGDIFVEYTGGTDTTGGSAANGFYAVTVNQTDGSLALGAIDLTVTADDLEEVTTATYGTLELLGDDVTAGNVYSHTVGSNDPTYVIQTEGEDGEIVFYQAVIADDGSVTRGAEMSADPLSALDEALKGVDSLRSELGAVQNRFEDAITNLNTNETNLAAARSRIEDADYAVEVANMTRAQILQQAGTSVLAQANQIPQIALSLLG